MEKDEGFMPFGKKVNDEIGKPKKTIVKNVTFPVDVFEEFDNYAKEMTGHCYWLAIKELINNKKKNEEVNEQLSTFLIVVESINDRLKVVETQINEKPKTELTYFGKVEEKK